MPRSVKKGPFVDPSLMKKVMHAVQNNVRKPIKTRSRRSMILPKFVGLIIEVHNGRLYVPVKIQEGMVGKKLGEFSLTRKFTGHKDKTGGK